MARVMILIIGCTSNAARAIGAKRTGIKGFVSPVPGTIIVRALDDASVWLWPVDPQLSAQPRMS